MMNRCHARYKHERETPPPQPQAKIQILMVKKEPGVETAALLPGRGGNREGCAGEKAHSPGTLSGLDRPLLAHGPREPVDCPPRIPEPPAIGIQEQRSSRRSDTGLLNRRGSSIQKSGCDLYIVIENHHPRHRADVQSRHSAIGSTAETRVVRTAHQQHPWNR